MDVDISEVSNGRFWADLLRDYPDPLDRVLALEVLAGVVESLLHKYECGVVDPPDYTLVVDSSHYGVGSLGEAYSLVEATEII